jgi:phospholipid N-methyltransferase
MEINHVARDRQQPRSAVSAGPVSQALLFVANFIKHPTMVGWLLPSSRFLVNEVLNQIDWNKAKVIVEYGPGVGSFTRAVLQRMRPDARLIAIELNAEFCGYLNATLRDPRLQVVNESATEIDSLLNKLRLPKADYVISGIPFKTMPDPLRDLVVRKTHSILKPDGSFLVYQFSGTVRPYLERVFGRVSRDFKLLNILPARLFYCAR